MNYLNYCFNQFDKKIILLFLLLLLNKKTRKVLAKSLFASLLTLIYGYFFISCRDQELVKIILNNFKPSQIIEMLSNVRLTSSKSMPDFKNIDLNSLLKAIKLRISSIILSPIKEYCLWIKTVLSNFIKEITKQNELLMA